MMTEQFWNRLLRAIVDGNVIPVIGSQILTRDGHSFHRMVAERLLESYGIDTSRFPFQDGREINDAVCKIKADSKGEDLYGAVADAVQSASRELSANLPPALSQFAAITDFRLIVYLGSDNLLARALSERAQVKEIMHAPNLPPSDKHDLDSDWKSRAGEVNLLYLFGKARGDYFAIHDEDILEYTHNLMSGGQGIPTLFLDEMQSRNLLLIGCCFPDWLMRFFLRLFSGDRLLFKRKHDWFIEHSEMSCSDLTVFLNIFSRDFDSVSGVSAADFIDELYRRWRARREETSTINPVIPVTQKGALFFISYSRQTDAPAAQKIYEKLRELGVAEGEIWFDRETIEPGEDYQKRIFTGIDRCRYFLPVISVAADKLPEKFFRREWRRAINRQEAMASGYNFVYPLTVDEGEQKPEIYRNVPSEWLERIHFGHAPGGEPDARTFDTLKKWLRQARSQPE